MKRVIEMTDTIMDISRKSGIPETLFRHTNGRKIRKDAELDKLVKKATKR